MTKYSGADCGFLAIAGYDVLQDTTEVGVSASAETKDKTPLGSAWRTYHFTGLKIVEFLFVHGDVGTGFPDCRGLPLVSCGFMRMDVSGLLMIWAGVWVRLM